MLPKGSGKKAHLSYLNVSLIIAGTSEVQALHLGLHLRTKREDKDFSTEGFHPRSGSWGLMPFYAEGNFG